MRLDKWLWCARFYKTRTLATEEISKGRVQLNESPTKASREVKVGDTLCISNGPLKRTITVKALSSIRGPATAAQLLYEETAASIALRDQQATMRKLAPEPADMLRHGRPTKKDRRDMQQFTGQWNEAELQTASPSDWMRHEVAPKPQPQSLRTRSALDKRWSSSHPSDR
ncbi:RNA-binding S4 domain-containing protein [Lampropedia puyangensis]|uniref:RNA-binding S4 domain-containing protein n=2 Tax=Lampropedia puyangensis TaxID=1330072 RepID=A0A4V4GSC5_9BURK|nr:RNA-binding S4 domain-containing protein [Lampropedia puyangensis]